MVIKMIIRTFVSTFLIATLLLSNAYAAVNARLEQTMVYTGDPITLQLETNSNTNAQPDLSVLEADFQVLNTSTSSQVNILNGRRSFKKTWSVSLQAKKEGEITIPEITIGNEKTNALSVTIQDIPEEVKAETSKHAFVESSVDMQGDETYVQQQIPYTVRFFYDSNMQSAEIQAPVIENAVLEQLGEDRRYQVRRNSKLFTVVEKNFVISPEKSGALNIPPAVIKGRISLTNTEAQTQKDRRDRTDLMNRFFNDLGQDPFFRGDPFADDFFSRRSRGPSKPFSIESEAIDVTVLSVPKEFTGDTWLPAEQLVIVDSWAKSPPELKVGEPVNRTITLQVKGLASSQIPNIELPKPEGVKSYPDDPNSVTRTDGSTVIGTQRLSLTYIPSKAGATEFPPINIDWWDVINKKQKTATLPAWNLNIVGGAVVDENKAATPKAVTEEKVSDSNLDENQIQPNQAEKEQSLFNMNSWTSILWMLLTLTVGLLLLWFAKKYLRTFAHNNKKRDLRLLKASLINACENNDKQLVEKQLIKYAALSWDDDSVQNLSSISRNIDNGAELIVDLENSLYASNKSDWNGDQLLQLVKSGIIRTNRTKQNSEGDDGLSPLYPA